MADVKAMLTRKVGPLPLGVWLAAGAAGLYIGSRRRSRGEPDALEGLAGSSAGSSATRDGDAVQAPDEGNVVVSPVLYLPELPAPVVVPEPGAGLADAPDAPWAPAETVAPMPEPVLTEAAAPSFRPPVPGAGSARYAEQARRYARKSFVASHPELQSRMDEPKRKATFLANHRKIARNLRKLSKPVR